MALIGRFPLTPRLHIMAQRRWFAAISLGAVLLSLGLLIFPGLNYGVDFRGGIAMEVRGVEPLDLSELRRDVAGIGVGAVTFQTFGGPRGALITVAVAEDEAEESAAIVAQIKEVLGTRIADYRRSEYVGPKVGADLKRKGFLSIALALFLVAAYIWLRFEWQFSLAAVLALSHDVILTLGFFAITRIEFNLATTAAILTIAGYSINDTVVVFDRVRDCLRRYKAMPLAQLLDQAISETFSRTLLTSLTTLAALVGLALLGGPIIQGMVFGLIFGLLVGTYSSVGLALPLLLWLRLDRLRGSTREKERVSAP